MYSAQLTQRSDSRLENKDGGAGHHPVIVILRAGASLLGRQRSAGLRVRVGDTERLHTLVSLAEDDVALEVDGVGVREPEHRVQPRGRHSAAGVKHELGENILLGTPAATRGQLVRCEGGRLVTTYPLLLRSLTELFLSLNAKQFRTLMPYFSVIDFYCHLLVEGGG